MSSTSLRIQSKDTIYQILIKEFLKEGKDFLLKRNFELGEGWDFKNVVFLYNYLPLLCIMSCNTEYYFNEKIKEMLSVDYNSKICIDDDLDMYNKKYEEFLAEGNSGTFIEFLLTKIKLSSIQNSMVEWSEKSW